MLDEILIEEQGTPPADAVEITVDSVTGYVIRHCKGTRGFLTWQAGLMEVEKRWIPISVLSDRCELRSVSIFRLLGYGWSREEAIVNAELNPYGKNGL